MPETPKNKSISFYRLTLKDVDDLYQHGLITPRGAIFLTVAACKPRGETFRVMASTMCDRFGFDKSTFYRQLSYLKFNSLLDYSAEGYLHLWRPVLDTDGNTENVFFPELSRSCDSKLHERNSKSRERNSKSRERNPKSRSRNSKTAENQLQKPAQAHSLDQLDQLDLSLDKSEREKCVIEPEFRQWLTVRASLLPHPPALLEQWIQRQAKLQVNRAEFIREQQARERASVPATASAQIFDDRSMEQQRLDTLQHWWDDGEQVKVKAAIDSHPEWGLTIGEFGPEVANAAET